PDSELPAGADHAERDLAAIGDQYFAEHLSAPGGRRRRRGSGRMRPPPDSWGRSRFGLDAEEHVSVLDGLRVLDADLADDARDLRLELVHELHRLEDAERLPLHHPAPD